MGRSRRSLLVNRVSATSDARGATTSYQAHQAPVIGASSAMWTGPGGSHCVAFAVLLLVAFCRIYVTAQVQPSTADESIAKDRTFRQSILKTGRKVPPTPKFGFFGTIFHLILEQVNDTKSAYNQITELVNGQFSDDTVPVTEEPDPANNGTTESSKISRAEFLKILDRNLKGLARLRALEWREARKDSWANLQKYKDEIVAGKNQNGR